MFKLLRFEGMNPRRSSSKVSFRGKVVVSRLQKVGLGSAMVFHVSKITIFFLPNFREFGNFVNHSGMSVFLWVFFDTAASLTESIANYLRSET